MKDGLDHERAIQDLAVEGYLLGEMTPGEREAFEEHFFECPACAEDVREAMQLMDGAREVLKADPVVDQPAPKWFAWLTPRAAAAAMAVLSVVCVVETLTIPALRRRLEEASAPRVASYVFLKPQTRGAAKVLKVAAGEPLVLMFDPPDSPPSRLQYVVKSADGSVQFELSSDAPAMGEPIILSIPKLDLQPGNYMLIVRASAPAGQDGQELGRYPFDLQRP
jgi:hypothetical protein